MGFLCGVYRWQQNLLVLRLWEDGGCIPIDTLIGKATLPCIACWEQNHFVCYSGQPRQIPVVFSNSLCLKLLYRVFVSYSVCLSVPKRYAAETICRAIFLNTERFCDANPFLALHSSSLKVTSNANAA